VRVHSLTLSGLFALPGACDVTPESTSRPATSQPPYLGLKPKARVIMGKEVKGFDPVECHIKDAMIGKEYSNLFPFGFSSIQGVNLPINHFKRSPVEIIYNLLSKKHVNEIKMRIIVYNNFDTKVLIFAIPEDPERPNCILPCCPRKWEYIQNFQILIVSG
jgi:hypothetical protein